MAGTNVLYNNVLISDVETRRFSQQIEYDESRTDQLFSRFSIRVVGSVHADPQYFHGTTGPGSASSATAAMAIVQARLSHPRGTFAYTVGGETLLAANAVASSPACDVNNGPKPVVVDIVQVVGRNLYRVEFEIEICLVLCGGAPTDQGTTQTAQRNLAVLNNRWSLRDERDTTWLTTRTLSGVLRVFHVNKSAHLYRYLCIPQLQRGYQRQSMSFEATPDGLNLRYTIVDRQRCAAPPPPAIDWEATYSESAISGAIGVGEMRVMLLGEPATPKIDLIKGAMLVVFERLHDLRKKHDEEQSASTFMTHFVVTEFLHENRIEVQVRVQYASAEQKIINARVAMMGKELKIDEYDPLRWPSPNAYDSDTPAAAFAQYLQSPCVDAHGIPQVQSVAPENQDPGQDDTDQRAEPKYTITQDIEDDDQSHLDASHISGCPYTHYSIAIGYAIQHHIAHLPIARWSTAAPKASTSVAIPLSGGLCRQTITVHGERVGDWPEFPQAVVAATDPNQIGMRLLRKRFIPEQPELMADGQTQLYKAQLRLEYAMSRAPAENEQWSSGADPRVVATPKDNRIDGRKVFTQGRIV